MILSPTMVVLIPALLLALWAQHKVKSTFAKFSEVPVRSGLTGADVAQRILVDAGIPGECALECVQGNLTDHYDPRSKTLRLSHDVYHGRSVAALGVAAHEVGHAIQHAHGYGPLHLRGMMYPVSNIGSTLAFPLFFIGLFIPTGLGQGVMMAAIALFTLAVIFTLITLPVEFDASSRALRSLEHGGYVTQDELSGARRVLNAAAMTYVASAAMAISQLIQYIWMAQSRN